MITERHVELSSRIREVYCDPRSTDGMHLNRAAVPLQLGPPTIAVTAMLGLTRWCGQHDQQPGVFRCMDSGPDQSSPTPEAAEPATHRPARLGSTHLLLASPLNGGFPRQDLTNASMLTETVRRTTFSFPTRLIDRSLARGLLSPSKGRTRHLRTTWYPHFRSHCREFGGWTRCESREGNDLRLHGESTLTGREPAGILRPPRCPPPETDAQEWAAPARVTEDEPNRGLLHPLCIGLHHTPLPTSVPLPVDPGAPSTSRPRHEASR